MFAIAGQQPSQQFAPLPQQNYQPQPQQFANNLQAQQQAYSQTEMNFIFEQINYMQGDSFLRGYLMLTHQIQDMNARSLTSATSDGEWLTEEPDPIAREDAILNVNSLYKTVKKRSQDLLKKTMDLRLKVSMQLYLSRIHSSRDQTQLQIINDRIRNVKMSISQKFTRLRLERLMAGTHQKQSTLIIPPQMPFDELKKATEILQSETMKLREELKLVLATAKDEKK